MKPLLINGAWKTTSNAADNVNSIPNVASNVYCVYTNRTPATAMRGFGITGVDFAIECHMDKVAEAVDLDPIELRILNAYRDGDMKAHRRVAKNTALIECCQVAAQKAGWAIGAEAAQTSSLVGGGEGWRGEIPETPTDQAGRIGERRRAEIPAEPFGGATSKGRIPAGTHGEAVVAAPEQDPDMVIDSGRVGRRKSGAAPYAARATARPTIPGPAMPPAAHSLAQSPQPTPPPQRPASPPAVPVSAFAQPARPTEPQPAQPAPTNPKSHSSAA